MAGTRLFGTDGIRGRAGTDLTAELAHKAAFGFASALDAQARYARSRRPAIAVGRDPRLSSPMLEAALCSGLAQAGCDVVQLGIVPTPLVPFAVQRLKAAGGVMVTASHNPVHDNGIKFFNSVGRKITTKLERAIERSVSGDTIGIRETYFGAIATWDPQPDYVAFTKRVVRQGKGRRVKVVLDCAFGSCSELAPAVFRAHGYKPNTICSNFDGAKLNVKCGATDLGKLKRAVRENKADLGLAFDGDGDRVLAVCSKGKAVSGDKIIALFASMLPRYKKQGAVVMTQMTNMGVEQELASSGIQMVRTEVGDIQVLNAMEERGLNLGGEQSGHIIMRDLLPTGDGILAGLQLAAILGRTSESLDGLVSRFGEYPQQLTNLSVRDKQAWQGNKTLLTRIGAIKREYKSTRFYLRPSGTENVVRVLTECSEPEMCKAANSAICEAIEAWNKAK